MRIRHLQQDVHWAGTETLAALGATNVPQTTAAAIAVPAARPSFVNVVPPLR